MKVGTTMDEGRTKRWEQSFLCMSTPHLGQNHSDVSIVLGQSSAEIGFVKKAFIHLNQCADHWRTDRILTAITACQHTDSCARHQLQSALLPLARHLLSRSIWTSTRYLKADLDHTLVHHRVTVSQSEHCHPCRMTQQQQIIAPIEYLEASTFNTCSIKLSTFHLSS